MWRQIFSGVLSAPTGLTATTAATDPEWHSTINVSWNAVPGATNYIVERDDNSGFTSPTQAYSGASTNFSDTTRPDGDQFWYRVKAQASGYSDSPWSSDDNDITVLKEPVLSTLSNGTPSYSEIHATYNDGGSQTETEIRAYVSSTGPSSGFSLKETWAANSTSGDIAPLSEYTQYWVKLVNYNPTYGESAASSVLTHTTALAPINAPTGLAAVAECNPNGYSMTWTDNSANEDGFKIYRRVYGTETWNLRHTTGAEAEDWSDHTGYSASDEYEWAVRAFRNSPTYQESSLNTDLGSNPIPGTPGTVTMGTAAEGAENEIDAPWSGGSGATSFKVYRRIDSSGGGSQIDTTTAASPYTDNDFPLAAQQTGVPSGVNITNVTYNSLQLNWTNNAPTGQTLCIDKKIGAGSWSKNWKTFSGTPPTSTLDNGLDPDTLYSYRLRYRDQDPDGYSYAMRGTNACGDGPLSSWSNAVVIWEWGTYSSTASATTDSLPAPNPPTNFSWAQSGSDSASIEWTDNSDNEDGFRLEYSKNGGAYTFISNRPANDELYEWDTTGLFTTGDEVEVRIRSYNATGPSSWVYYASDPQTWT